MACTVCDDQLLVSLDGRQAAVSSSALFSLPSFVQDIGLLRLPSLPEDLLDLDVNKPVRMSCLVILHAVV